MCISKQDVVTSVIQLFITGVCFSSQCLFENIQRRCTVCVCQVRNKFEPSSRSFKFVSYWILFDDLGNPLVVFEVLTSEEISSEVAMGKCDRMYIVKDTNEIFWAYLQVKNEITHLAEIKYKHYLYLHIK